MIDLKKKEKISNTYKIQIISPEENEKKISNYTNEITEENDEDESGNNIIELKNCQKESKKEVTFKDQISNRHFKNNLNLDIDKEINNKSKHLVLSKMQKIRNLSSSNIHELTGIKEGNIDSFRGNPKYKKIIQSFTLTEEESKRKTENKTPLSPKHTVETEKNVMKPQ